MPPTLQAMCAAVIALAAGGQACAADLTPTYIGTDYGVARYAGRVYAGYAVGSSEILGQESTHYLELMGYTLGFYGKFACPYPAAPDDCRRDVVRAKGLALNWASATQISEHWTANTRIGVSLTHAKVYDAFDPNHGAKVWDSLDGVAGAGVAYSVAPHVSVRADVNYMPIKTNDDNKPRSNAVTTGVDYKF